MNLSRHARRVPFRQHTQTGRSPGLQPLTRRERGKGIRRSLKIFVSAGELFRAGEAFANGARRAALARFYGRKVRALVGGNGSCQGEARGSLPVLSPQKF